MEKADHHKGPDHYEIWTDGCAFDNGKYIGGGWIVFKNGTRIAEYSRPLPMNGMASATIAEVKTVELALRSVPPGSKITLHSDLNTLPNLLRNGGEVEHRNNNNVRKVFKKSVSELFNVAACHDLTIIESHDKYDFLMREAHYLAQAGAAKCKNGILAPAAKPALKH